MIPDFQTLMRPALVVLADGGTHRVRDVVAKLAEEFDLTDDERQTLLPSGRQRTMDNRVGWALTYLYQAGLTTRPKRAHVQISDSGKRALIDHSRRIDMKVLEQFPTYLEFRERTRSRKPKGDGVSELAPPESATPEDLIVEAVNENRAVIADQLLRRSLDLPPTGFEALVMKLLAAMGYGASGVIEATSATGDAGIDGIISQDPLGLDRIYVQAKRYQPDNVVHRPIIQSFVGALMGAQGDRGVFLTTSSFSAGAREEAERVGARIELIDGARLAQLMVDHRVGVQAETVATLLQLDEDYFEDL